MFHTLLRLSPHILVVRVKVPLFRSVFEKTNLRRLFYSRACMITGSLESTNEFQVNAYFSTNLVMCVESRSQPIS